MPFLPILKPEELHRFTTSPDLVDQVHALLQQQRETWPLLRTNYESLALVRTRTFEFEGFQLKIQFNPGRYTSSAAKVDDQSIQARKCFLCWSHLPSEQRGILYRGVYLILSNPFRIFPEHFTIPSLDHIPQRIEGQIGVLLDFAAQLARRYVVFYNGPRCGASAPDHLHFQAGSREFMTIGTEYPEVASRYGRELVRDERFHAVAVEKGYLRRFVAFESPERALVQEAFEILVEALRSISADQDEPMMNVLMSYSEAGWRVIVFPRARHRPAAYFAEGEKRILLSPAAVDLGGVCITPVEEDFVKLTKDDLIQILDEVTLGSGEFEEAVEMWRSRWMPHVK